jgi:chromosome segregation ATPase
MKKKTVEEMTKEVQALKRKLMKEEKEKKDLELYLERREAEIVRLDAEIVRLEAISQEQQEQQEPQAEIESLKTEIESLKAEAIQQQIEFQNESGKAWNLFLAENKSLKAENESLKALVEQTKSEVEQTKKGWFEQTNDEQTLSKVEQTNDEQTLSKVEQTNDEQTLSKVEQTNDDEKVLGFSIRIENTWSKGIQYSKYYAIKRIQGKHTRIYIGENRDKARQKILAYCGKHSLIL